MASTTVAAGPVEAVELDPLPDQQRAYATDVDSAERASPPTLEEMQPLETFDGLRRRGTQGPGPSSSPEGGESPVASPVSAERTLTAGSNENNQQDQAYRVVTWTRQAWQKVFGSTVSGSSNLSNASTVIGGARKGFDYENDKRLVHERVEDYTEGFPRLAALLNSNPSFTVFRAFGQCHARVLVQLQVEITKLEKELQEQDKSDIVNADFEYRLKSTGFYHEGYDPTKDLLARLQAKLIEYGDFLLRYNQIRALGKAPQRHYRSVLRWVLREKPLDPGYYDFIFHFEDFLSVTGYTGQGGNAEKLSFFEDCIESYLSNPKSRLKSFFETKTEARKSTDPTVHHYSPARFALAEKAFVVFVANACILMPVFLLFLIDMDRVAQAMTVLAFGFAFSIILSVVTRGKPQEVIIGTIAQVLSNTLGRAQADAFEDTKPFW